MFERVDVPTPFPSNSVNSYIAGNTVVDPGPATMNAWNRLYDALDGRDKEPADVEQVVVTHPHIDHFGQAARFQERGATVIAARRAAPVLGHFQRFYADSQSYLREVFVTNGMDRRLATDAVSSLSEYAEYALNVSVDRTITSGETLNVDGRPVRVDVTNGHSTGELLLRYTHEGRRHALVGDHVLPEITPNPVLQKPRPDGNRRRNQVLTYNRSLERLRGSVFERLHPGHGAPITAVEDRIASILAFQRERSRTVRKLASEPVTAYRVVQSMFGDVDTGNLYPAMSEAIGHLRALELASELESTRRDNVVRYRPA